MTQGKAQAIIKIVKVDKTFRGDDIYTWFIWAGGIRIRTMSKYKNKKAARRTATRWCQRLGLQIKQTDIKDLTSPELWEERITID